MTLNDNEFETQDVKVGSEIVAIGTPLGSGKEGTVYGIQGSHTEVMKIFETSRRTDKRRKVKEMVRNPPEDPTKDKSNVPALIWPIEAVHSVSNDDFLGYTMPRLEMDEFVNAQKYARNALDHTTSDADFRYLAAMNLALRVALVHTNGHGMGDMHHSNILVKDGIVTLIDCDGFHISGKYRDFGGATIYPRYEPPDTRSQDDDVRTVQLSDQFGLAVHIFQFLMGGYHPFVAVGSEATTGSTKNAIHGNKFPYSDPNPGQFEPPDRAPDYSSLPAEIKDLFEAVFISGKTNPTYRPTATDWVNALARASSIDTSGSDPVQPKNTDESLGDQQDKWEHQREQRQQQYTSPGSKQSSDLGDSDSASSDQTRSGDSYRRNSSNWAEDIRNNSSTSEKSNSSQGSTTGPRSGSGTTTNSSASGVSGGPPNFPSSSASESEDSNITAIDKVVSLIALILLICGMAYFLLSISSLFV